MTEELKAYIERLIQEEVRPTLRAQADELMRETRLNGDFLREQWKHYPTREERRAEAEQRAWDGAYDAILSSLVLDGNYFSPDDVGGKEGQARTAAAYADVKLEERRKRFGAGKEAHPGSGNVAVPAGVLLGAADLLDHGGSEEHRKASAAVLRALVSE